MSSEISNCYVRRQLGGLSTEVLGSAAVESLKLHRDVITKFPTANVVEYFRAEFFAVGSTVQLNAATGSLTTGGSGTQQIEVATITAAGGATSNGNLNLVLTGAGITGSPLTVPVPLTTAAHTTAALIAAACVAQLRTIPSLTALYDVFASSGATILLNANRPRANDTTLNLAIPAALGVTAAPSSANTPAGVAGVWVNNDDFNWGESNLGGFEPLHLEILPPSGGNIIVSNFGVTAGAEIIPGQGLYGPGAITGLEFEANSVPASPLTPTVVEFIVIGRDPHKV